MFIPRLECLEDRLVPANVVHTAFDPVSKTLTIKADDDLTVIANNHQDITLTGAGAGNFTISGAGTTISGGASFSGVKNIKLIMGLGNDNVRFITANLPGKLSVLGGHGINSVTIGETAGNNTFGSVRITNLDGYDNFTMHNGTNVISGALVVDNGPGGSSFTFGDTAGDRSAIGSIAITNAGGEDDYVAGGISFEVLGQTVINNGRGDTFANFTVGTLSLGSTKIVNRNGHDLWSFGIGGDVTLQDLSIQNGVGGSNTIFIGATNTITGNLSVISGDGPDTFLVDSLSVDDFQVGGNLTIQNGNGGSTTKIAASSNNEIGGLLTIGNAAGDDTLTLGAGTGNLDFHQAVISNGNGASASLIAANIATFTGSLSVSNGDGNDTFEVAGANVTVTGALKLSNGRGDTTTNIHPSVNTSIGGKLAITNGAGDDTLTFSNFGAQLHNISVVNGNGTSATSFTSSFGTLISGNLTISNGQGEDTFDTNGPIWTVTGDVTIQNGDGGSTVTIDAGIGSDIDNHIGGDLTIIGQDASDDIDLRKLDVAGVTLISTGDSNDFFDFISIANSDFAGPVTIQSGGGTDFLSIEIALDDGVSTTFQDRFILDAGSGDDHLTMGLNSGDIAVFNLAPVKLNGGDGLDTLSGVGVGNVNDFPPGQPTLAGWEAVS